MNVAISHVVTSLLLLSQTRHSMSKRPITSFFQSVKKPRAASEEASVASSTSRPDGPSSLDAPNSQKKPKYTLFCDLDGVLVDFDAGVRKLLGGKSPDQVPSHRLWPAIHRSPHFFRDLPWTDDGEELWEVLRMAPFRCVNILTGVSSRGDVVRDKYLWCQRELCVETQLVDMTGPAPGRKHEPVHPHTKRKKDGTVVNVIACWSKNKHLESKPGQYVTTYGRTISMLCILIDDRDKLRDGWEKAGGKFILHTSTSSTLAVLRELGIVGSHQQEKDVQKPPQTKQQSPSRIDSERSSSDPAEATQHDAATKSCGR